MDAIPCATAQGGRIASEDKGRRIGSAPKREPKSKEGVSMRTIAIINQKGGCGKTTTSINLAACLARLGQKTLLLDMDPQGHCAVGLAVPEEQIERTILDALIEERDGTPIRLLDTVWQIASDYDLSPANIKLAAFEQMFAGRPGREDRLKNALKMAAPTYRWCIIDCPPSVGLLTFNALRACDEVIVPVETGYFSLHGLAKMMQTLEIMREKCGKDILIRVLPTLYDTRTKLAREVLSELRNKFREYLMESTVNFNTKLKEAASFGQPITEYDPGSRGYKDFLNLARELMGHRPEEVEPVSNELLSRPAELVQRAKQLAQLTNLQFGKGTTSVPAASPAAQPPVSSPFTFSTPAPIFSEPTFERSSLLGDKVEQPQGSVAVQMPVAATTQMLVISDDKDFGQEEEEVEMPELALQLEAREPEAAEPSIMPEPVAKTTAEKIAEFYGVKQVGGEVIFAARFDDAKKVLIAGDFNNWSPMSTPMINRGEPGEFWMCLPLRPGRYRYRFVVDGKWMTDPNNNYVETNQFGELNNVIEVD
jgi:chromosome partitioning protein